MGSPGHHQFLLGAKHLNCSQNEVSGHLCWLWIWSDSGCTMEYTTKNPQHYSAKHHLGSHRYLQPACTDPDSWWMSVLGEDCGTHKNDEDEDMDEAQCLLGYPGVPRIHTSLGTN